MFESLPILPNTFSLKTIAPWVQATMAWVALKALPVKGLLVYDSKQAGLVLELAPELTQVGQLTFLAYGKLVTALKKATAKLTNYCGD